MEKIILSNEISSVFPKSENEQFELETLEKSLTEEGCRDALLLWKEQNILLDGHRRFEICQRLSIPFDIKYLSFASMEDATGFTVRSQLSRRNLNKWQSSMLIINHRENHNKELADNNKKLIQGRGIKGQKDSDSAFSPIDVNTELAKEAAVSRYTIVKAKYIIKNGNDELHKELNSNETSINKAYHAIRRRVNTPYN